jgi:hypothetical protein
MEAIHTFEAMLEDMKKPSFNCMQEYKGALESEYRGKVPRS